MRRNYNNWIFRKSFLAENRVDGLVLEPPIIDEAALQPKNLNIAALRVRDTNNFSNALVSTKKKRVEHKLHPLV
jgi:hypothetical protein